MDLPDELLQHAIALLDKTSRYPSEVDMRRAVSALYYALFHQINQDAVSLLAPHVLPETNHRIQRWFDHVKMKEICGRFMAPELAQPLLGLIGKAASPDLQTVARGFVDLQEARQRADYDLSYHLTGAEATKFARLAIKAMHAWLSIQGSAEANIFILSLLMFKNWEDKIRT